MEKWMFAILLSLAVNASAQEFKTAEQFSLMKAKLSQISQHSNIIQDLGTLPKTKIHVVRVNPDIAESLKKNMPSSIPPTQSKNANYTGGWQPEQTTLQWKNFLQESMNVAAAENCSRDFMLQKLSEAVQALMSEDDSLSDQNLILDISDLSPSVQKCF